MFGKRGGAKETPAHTPIKKKPKSASRSLASQSTKASPLSFPRSATSHSLQSPSAKTSSPGKTEAAPPDSPAEAGASGSAQRDPGVRGRTSYLAKFSGKPVDEILGPIGLTSIKETFSEIIAAMGGVPFTESSVAGEEHEKFVTLCNELKKKATTMQKQTVAMDIRIHKWKQIPDGVESSIKNWRNKATTLGEAFAQFSMANTRRVDANKMEQCLACFQCHELEVPSSFHVKFFMARYHDLLCKGQMEEFVNFIHPTSGYIAACDLVGKQPSGAELAAEAIAEGLLHTVRHYATTAAQVCNKPSKCQSAPQLADLTRFLVSAEICFGEQELNDLTCLHKMIGGEEGEKQGALDKLETLSGDPGYDGILSVLVKDSCWKAVIAAQRVGLSSTLQDICDCRWVDRRFRSGSCIGVGWGWVMGCGVGWQGWGVWEVECVLLPAVFLNSRTASGLQLEHCQRQTRRSTSNATGSGSPRQYNLW